MSYTINLTQQQVQQLLETYREYLEDPNNNYTLFRAKCNNSYLTVYKTNTALIQGKDEYEFYCKVCKELNIEPVPEDSQNKLHSALNALQSIIGTDEVGTGDFFGGVVVAGCFVPKNEIFNIRKLGVKDSKELSDSKILEIAPILMKTLVHSISRLDALHFNYLVSHYKLNMNAIKSMMHNSIVLSMINKVPEYDAIIIDAFTTRQNYFNYLKNEKKVCDKVVLEEKAENKFISVACASIIARYTFLKDMETLSKEVGFELPKGAGKPVDTAILKIYQEKGVGAFKNISKMNFKNFDKYRQ